MGKDIFVVELFAGVGGFRYGLEKASERFKTVWANQWEPKRKNQFAFNCYDRHYGGSESINVNQDIALVQDEVPNHDLLVGGFPCQDYSVASTNAEGITGKKGVLWWNINQVLTDKRPRFVLLENVDRLLKSPAKQRGRDFGIILRCLHDLGYDAEWRVINASEYGEVQRRRRVFIFASERKTNGYTESVKESDNAEILEIDGFFAKAFPIEKGVIGKKESTFRVDEDSYSDLVSISDNFAEKFYRAGSMRNGEVYTREYLSAWKPIDGEKIKTLGSILTKNVEEKYFVDDEDDIARWKFMKGPKKIERTKRGTDFKYLYSEGGIAFPDPLDSPGRTMLTSEGTMNRSSHLIMDPSSNRYRILTPVECERLNGFPDGWTEDMSERNRYFAMGNALVVPLITKMGEQILKYFDFSE